MIKKAVGYIRVSSAHQVEGFSLSAQNDAIHDYCRRNDIELVSVFEDAGISGASIDNRKGLISLIQTVKNDPSIKTVIIWKLSRLGRNTYDLLNISNELKKYDANIISIQDGIDTSHPLGKMFYTMVGIFAELERDSISAQATLGMEKNALSGNYGGGKPPIGYDKIKDGPLTINEKEAKTVRLIFELYTNQNKGYALICKELNNNLQSHATKNGKKWSHTTIKQVLDNPIYVGIIRWRVHSDWSSKRRAGRTNNPILAKGNHEPIIDQTLWDRTVTKRKATGIRPEKKFETNHLLSGLPKCPACGSGMYSHRLQTRLADGTIKYSRYYACGSWKNKHDCKAYLVDAEMLESSVIDQLINFVKTADLDKIIATTMKNDSNAEFKKDSLRDATLLLDDIKRKEDSYYRKLVDPEALKKLSEEKIMNCISDLSIQRDDVTRRIEELEAELASIENAKTNAQLIADCLNNFNAVFDDAPIDLKKELIRALVKEIIIIDGKGPKERKIKELKLVFDLDDLQQKFHPDQESRYVAIYDTAHSS